VRERFIREARAAAAIRSPYICDVYDSGMYEDRPFLVMELLEGESLYDMMTRVRQLDAQTTLRIATHSARGLAKAHDSNVVHRDLKPENIFLTKDEDGRLLAKILDFGLAKFYEPSSSDSVPVRLTREGALFGTPAYMSPEQAKGQGEVDHRADLWALGCIVYECLTGQTVWNVEQGVAMILAQIASSPLPRPTKLRPDLPAAFDTWFERALDRDPSKRFQTAREFADTLSDALYPKEGAKKPPASLYIDADTFVKAEVIAPEPSSVPERVPSPAEATPPGLPREPARAEPEPQKTSSVRAVSALMVVAALALGGYAAWLYVLHPPGKAAAPAPSTTAPRPKRVAQRETKVADVKSAGYVEALAEAQGLLATEPKRALEVFKAAFDKGNMPAARSLLTQASVALEEGGPCQVTALGRPRPVEIEVPVSRPAIVTTSQGAVMSWVDNHLDMRRRQAFTVQLDPALRRLAPPIAVTPEAHNVRQPQLVRAGDKLALFYWDEGGREPGVYLRMLDAAGKIESPTLRLSSQRRGNHHPALTALPDGEFMAVWEEEFHAGSSDIVARRLGADLKPKGPLARLTALHTSTGANRQARTADATAAHGNLYVTFAKDLGGDRVQIMLLVVPLTDPGLETGVTAVPPAKSGSKTKPRKTVDQSVGSLRALGTAQSKNAQPHIACLKEGCFVAWDDDRSGAIVSFWDKERGPLWHREFARKAARSVLASDERGVALAYYEDSRVKLATLSRDGVGKPSIVSRVNGYQPYPDLARGEKPGQWYVAFRDFESAHLEIFALRADCP
jgi:serine/threonine-protein kinase